MRVIAPLENSSGRIINGLLGSRRVRSGIWSNRDHRNLLLEIPEHSGLMISRDFHEVVDDDGDGQGENKDTAHDGSTRDQFSR